VGGAICVIVVSSARYRPSAQFSVNALLTALLLLTGDIELNSGPATVHSLNTQSAVLQTAIVHNLIDELELDGLALTKTWI